MKGIIVYSVNDYNFPDGCGTAFRRLGLLITPEQTEFKKTLLKQGEYNAYGDSSVRHWKMSGSVDPNLEDFPYPWSGAWELTYPKKKPTYRVVGNYEFGTETCYWEQNQYTISDGKWNNWTRYEWKLVNGTEIWERRNKGQFDPSKPMRAWERKAWMTSSGRWSVPSGWHATEVEYDLHDPLPYYWIDYMMEIKPHESRDSEVLSEIIRNTISSETTLATNSYANLFECIEVIQDFRNGKVIELIEDSKKWWKIVKNAITNPSGKTMKSLGKRMANDASSAWLQYRYAYSTTKSDVEQFARQTLNNYLGNLDGSRVLRGSGKISNGVMHVKMRLHDNTQPNLDSILIKLDRYGLFPGLYNIWDMIPFSFIADWFSNLGDVLQDIDQQIYFRYYKVDELLVSTKQELQLMEPWGLTTYTWYERNSLSEMPQWEIYTEDPKSKKVWSCRAADALSIVTSVASNSH